MSLLEKRLEAAEQKLKLRREAVSYESYLDLVRAAAKESAQARLEPQVYCTLSTAEKIETHRLRITELRGSWPGIGEQMWALFIHNQEERIAELEAMESGQRAEKAQRAEKEARDRRTETDLFEEMSPEPYDRLSGYRERDSDCWEPREL